MNESNEVVNESGEVVNESTEVIHAVLFDTFAVEDAASHQRCGATSLDVLKLPMKHGSGVR